MSHSPETIAPVDALVVFGMGTGPEGISGATRQNALYAAQLLTEHALASGGVVIASGRGPRRDVYYPETEAAGMAAVIEPWHDGPVLLDEESHTTAENARNVYGIVTASARRIERVGLVTYPAHMRRAQQWLGALCGTQFDMVPLPNPDLRHAPFAAMDHLNAAVERHFIRRARIAPGDLAAYAQAEAAYQQATTVVKGAARKLSPKRYGGVNPGVPSSDIAA